MKKIMISLFSASVLFIQARDFRVPFMNLQFGAAHYPFEKTDEEKWYTVDVWSALYSRIAQNAFPCHDTTCTVPYSTLVFGLSDFTLEQSFSGQEAAIPGNPFVSISKLSPRFSYEERAAVFGLNFVARHCDSAWTFGFRTRLPVRDITMAMTCDNNITGEAISDVYQERTETILVDGAPPVNNVVFAARLDFLSTLNRIALDVNGNPVPMVNYSDPANGGRVAIAGQDVSNNIPALATISDPLYTNIPMVAVIGSENGVLPVSQRWGNVNTTITAVAQGNGSGVGTNVRGRFAGDINYVSGGLAADRAAQSRLFVVPTIADSTSGLDTIGTIVAGANTIESAIRATVNSLSNVTDFIATNSLNFCNGNTQGLGDLDLRVFAAHDFSFCDRYGFGELRSTLRLPTGKRIKNCKDLIKQAAGNNGHVEIMLGGALGYTPCDWLSMQLQGDYSWVLKRKESVAAPFAGAVVKNIGPCVCADVSWSYFIGAFDITCRPCCSIPCGFDLGYVLFTKSHDKICLPQKTAVDFAGNTQLLDACVLTKNTNEIAQRVRTEFFIGSSCTDIFLGWSYTFAGKNAPKETDFYLGLNIAF